jgi:hypothetical protein
MGEMADMITDNWDDNWDDSDMLSRSKVLKCRACNKSNLIWRKILDQWVMFETNVKVHTCGGYEPPIDVLKHIASEVLVKTQEESKWRLFDRAKNRGGLLKLLTVIPDDQLVDLYACFIRDKQLHSSNPDVGMNKSYDKEIEVLRKEIIQRMR